MLAMKHCVSSLHNDANTFSILPVRCLITKTGLKGPISMNLKIGFSSFWLWSFSDFLIWFYSILFTLGQANLCAIYREDIWGQLSLFNLKFGCTWRETKNGKCDLKFLKLVIHSLSLWCKFRAGILLSVNEAHGSSNGQLLAHKPKLTCNFKTTFLPYLKIHNSWFRGWIWVILKWSLMWGILIGKMFESKLIRYDQVMKSWTCLRENCIFSKFH